MSSLFNFSMKFEGKEVMKAKLQNVEDVEPIIEQLKIKFGRKK